MANGPIKDLVRKVRKKRATGGHSEPTVTKDKFQKRRRRSVVKTKGQDKPNVLYSGEADQLLFYQISYLNVPKA